MDSHSLLETNIVMTVETAVETAVDLVVEGVVEIKKEAEETEAWECVICCGDGARTGKVTLACSHETCLACFMKLTTTTTYYGTAPTELKCPFCRGTIRTTDGLTENEKQKVRSAVALVRIHTERVQNAEDQLAIKKREAVASRFDLDQVLRDFKITEAEAREIATATPHPLAQPRPQVVAQPRPQVVATPATPLATPLATPQGTPATPLTNVPHTNPERDRTKCPGCRSWRNSDLVRFRHVHDEDGTTRRLRRCDTCQDQARRNYEGAARDRLAWVAG
jgi:hypothetical protein